MVAKGEIPTWNRAERAHRITEIRIEAVGELHDAGSDFVEVDLLLPAISFNHEHSSFPARSLVRAKTPVNASVCAGCFQKRAIVVAILVPSGVLRVLTSSSEI